MLNGIARRRWLGVATAAAMAWACRSRVADVGGFTPVLEEDGHLVELLTEADHLAERDPAAAARNLRESIAPNAHANWEAAGRVAPTHPQAQALARRLVGLTDERAQTVDAYADVLARGDPSGLHAVVQRQIALDRAMEQLERDVQTASRAPATRACAVSPTHPTR